MSGLRALLAHAIAVMLWRAAPVPDRRQSFAERLAQARYRCWILVGGGKGVL